MIVNNQDLVRIAILPTKADPPLLIDANTVLSGPIAFKSLEAIARRRSEIAKGLGGIHDDELSEHGALQVAGIVSHRLAPKEPFRIPVPEALDHLEKLIWPRHNVKRY